MMITEDTALITVAAQGSDTREALVNATLSEAAKITRTHGFRYFVLLQSEDASTVVTRIIPGQTFYNHRSIPRSFGSGPNANIPPAEPYKLPDREVKLLRLGLDTTIRMYRDGDIDPSGNGVLDSEMLLSRAMR